MKHVTVIGAGLAGSECAWQLAQRGIAVTLCEMKPEKNLKGPKVWVVTILQNCIADFKLFKQGQKQIISSSAVELSFLSSKLTRKQASFGFFISTKTEILSCLLAYFWYFIGTHK